MKKYLVIGIFAMLVFSVLVLADPPTKVTATIAKGPANPVVVVPEYVLDRAPDQVIFLGTTTTEHRGQTVKVDGIKHLYYKKGNAKPGTVCGNDVCEAGENAKKCPEDCSGGDNGDTTSTCFAHLAKGAKWKVAEDVVINPSNSEGLDEATVVATLAGDIQKWEDAAGVDILGTVSSTSDVLVPDETSPDGKNEVLFGSISEPGVIASTITWGIYRGNPSNRELVEFDMEFDQDDYDWSLTGEAGKMDFSNIDTHEIGHGIGEGHPSDSCTEETMYRFAAEGETKKRDLHGGDIAGIQDLYN